MTDHAYQSVTFYKSVVSSQQLPADKGIEVAFIGRSNAGKSSALNTITGIKGLARTSKTPGRTQAINLFSVDKNRRLVDLPGYGYAKVPLLVKRRWEVLIDGYLEKRKSLKGLVLVMDVRHPLKDLDQQIIAWTVECAIPTHILLTKSDKLKKRAAQNTLHEVLECLEPYGDLVTAQLFSSLDKSGVREAVAIMDEWFDFEDV